MGTLWPDPPVLPARCQRCHQPVARARLIDGYGSDCARRLGLITTAPRIRVLPQTGPDLLQLLNDEPEDECDGWDY